MKDNYSVADNVEVVLERGVQRGFMAKVDFDELDKSVACVFPSLELFRDFQGEVIEVEVFRKF